MRSLLGCLVSGIWALSVSAVEPRPIDVGELPLLFADDSGIASSGGVIRSIHPARTRAKPVMKPEAPWEGRRIYVYGSVYHDETAGIFSMWYLGHPDVDAEGNKPRVPGFRTGKGDVVLYAESKDGLSWQKPELGLHPFRGSNANNIIFDLHSPSVLLDTHEVDPSKRYKMLGSLSGKYYAAVSPDGRHWSRFPDDRPILKYSDNISLCQDPATGEYLAYHRAAAGVRGRCMSLSRSSEFRAWTEPQLTFAADEEDNAWAKNPGERTEVNNLSVIPHAGGFLGFPTMFRVLGKDRGKEAMQSGQSPTDGVVEVQLITSADGLNWRRTQPRLSVIPRGEGGSFDDGTILGVSSTCVHVKDETWMYYTALTTSHGAPLPAKQNAIGRAEWRLHGFASLDAGEAGHVETKAVHFKGGELLVNANAAGGELRVALLTEDGNRIPGYAIADCEPLRTNETRWPARWRTAGTKLPEGKRLRVRIEMRQARLYSVSSGN